MFKVLIEKIKRIQRADEKTKKRWLIGLTASAMILIIGLWLIFLNNFSLPTIAPVADSPTTSSVAAAQPARPAGGKEDSIWQTFKRGLNEIIQNAKDQISAAKNSLEEQLQKNNETIIENQNVLPLTPPVLTTSTATH